MSESQPGSVPRQPDEPTPEQVLDQMNECEPYVASEIVELFEDVSRWTIQRRLETLHENGEVSRKKHSERRVTWYVQPS